MNLVTYVYIQILFDYGSYYYFYYLAAFLQTFIIDESEKKVHAEFDDTKSITILVCNLEFDIR